MTDHPTDLLILVAAGAVPPTDVAAHLGLCTRCRMTLAGLAPMDLGAAWDGVAAELDAPRPRLLERLALHTGLDPALARVVASAPSLSVAWLAASTAVLALGLLLAGASALTAASPALFVAPFVAAAAVSFAYGPAIDPAYPVVAVTPMSPMRILLARLLAVLAVDAALVYGIGLALGADVLGFGWLLPMAAVALLAVVVSSRFPPVVGAVTGMGAWLLVLGAVGGLADQRWELLTGPGAQLLAAGVAVSLLVLLRQRGCEGWPLAPETAAG